MSTHKHFDKIVCLVLVLAVAVTVLFMNGEALGIQHADRVMGYEARLFDISEVHTIDLVVDGWEEFLETCTDEEYITCAAVIDGEAYKNIAIRAKGNTSLSSVKNYGNNRYSFKLEFDHYDSSLTYHGLDKLCLNNLIQDNTLMKDFLVYQMMGDMGVPSPLCSYAYVTVNGEDWGLYLAVEAVEESFLQRNYGSDYGDLYKPDSMSFGGGRGNGKDFDMGEFTDDEGGFDPSKFFGEDFDIEAIKEQLPEDIQQQMPEDFDPSAMFGEGGFGGGRFPQEQSSTAQAPSEVPAQGMKPSQSGGRGERPEMGGFGGMGSSDTKLQYTDDNPDSYSNIFSSAKTTLTEEDEQRLIAALKRLSEGDTSAVEMEDVIMYFVVHNFVCNGDSYTGSMIHNYYLYEDDGALSMLPWDYNLAFGGFEGGQNATSTVNSPIDTPVNGTIGEDRPMISWIFSDESYTELYHEYFSEFLAEWFQSGRAEQLIDSTASLISDYVERDPTKFCTCEQFEAGVEALKQFVSLRAQSVRGQLDGSIPSTTEGQSGSGALVDASSVSISDMGSMGMDGGFGGRPEGGFGGWQEDNPDIGTQLPSQESSPSDSTAPPDGFEGMSPPDGFEGMTPPDDFEGISPPDGFEGMSPPDGFEGMTPPDGAIPQFPQ